MSPCVRYRSDIHERRGCRRNRGRSGVPVPVCTDRQLVQTQDLQQHACRHPGLRVAQQQPGQRSRDDGTRDHRLDERDAIQPDDSAQQRERE